MGRYSRESSKALTKLRQGSIFADPSETVAPIPDPIIIEMLNWAIEVDLSESQIDNFIQLLLKLKKSKSKIFSA